MKADRQEILDKLKEIILFSDETAMERCPVLGEDTRVLEDLGFSSVALLYMAVSIEEAFGIRLDNVNIWELRTLGDVMDMIQGKMA